MRSCFDKTSWALPGGRVQSVGKVTTKDVVVRELRAAPGRSAAWRRGKRCVTCPLLVTGLTRLRVVEYATDYTWPR